MRTERVKRVATHGHTLYNPLVSTHRARGPARPWPWPLRARESEPRARAGAVSMIKFDLKTGVMEGAADPRRPGLALGA